MELRIQRRVNETLAELPEDIRKWAATHLITPRKIAVTTDPNGGQPAEVWLVTDHTGLEDSNCRVVFDERTDAFGLEATLKTGESWYLGSYGSSFAVTVNAM